MEEIGSISRFQRTEGDGMESMEVPITSDVKSSIAVSTDMIKKMNLSPTKSPSQQRVINLVPNKVISPSSLPKQEVKPSNSSLLEKKARFVPYEPYKAAVKPIIPLPSQKPRHKTGASKKQNEEESNRKQSQELECSSISSHTSFISQEDYIKIIKEKEELEEQLKIQSKVFR